MPRRSMPRSVSTKKRKKNDSDVESNVKYGAEELSASPRSIGNDGSAYGSDAADDDAVDGGHGVIDANSSGDDDDNKNIISENSIDSSDETDDADGEADLASLTSGESASNKRRRRRRLSDPTPETLFTRGIVDNDRSAGSLSKGKRRRMLAGPLHEDFLPIRDAFDKWGQQGCRPTREPGASGRGGFAHSSSYTNTMVAEEHAHLRQWYFAGGGRAAFKTRQGCHSMSRTKAQQYMLEAMSSTVNVVHGPIDDPQLSVVSPNESLRMTRSSESSRPKKAGFMLNLGARIGCLEWVPNQPSGQQYITCTVLPQRPSESVVDASAYVAQCPLRSNIQIWQISVSKSGRPDSQSDPQLALVLCTTWGDAIALKWCRTSTNESDEMGLLAGVWADGHLRVLHVPMPESDGNTTYLEIGHAAFDARPPGTSFSCLTWLDSSHVAAGCADGYVAVFDIAHGLTLAGANPRPMIYTPISASYISVIESCYPSRPFVLLTASMTGLMAMTDLRQADPSTAVATAHAQRMRTGANQLIWNDFAQCAMSVDENSVVRAHPLRRFFRTVTVAKAQSTPTAMAVSPCHPFMLMGTAGGDVLTFNSIRRLIDRKADLWQQLWMTHEWRPPSVAETAAAREASFSTGSQTPLHVSIRDNVRSIAAHGLSRIADDFDAEPVTLVEDKTSQSQDHGAPYTTIYEERTAITNLTWNPNLHVGGWAAVGTANGLIRIEDIAL